MSSKSKSPSRNSTRSGAPRWRRTLSNAKSQQPASISLVFAQPEQAARLPSAIEQLPALAIDDASSIMSVTSRKRDRLHSQSMISRENDLDANEENVERKRSRTGSMGNPRGDAAESPPSGESIATEDHADHNRAVLSESPCSSREPPMPMESIPSPPLSIPTPKSEEVPETSKSPSRGSWLGSLAWVTGYASAESDSTSTARPTSPQPDIEQGTIPTAASVQPAPNPPDEMASASQFGSQVQPLIFVLSCTSRSCDRPSGRLSVHFLR
ncbi:uncharacterized protein LAESUDRAFT_242195 [Laetiporus sulphureus 93-53]|uniref:Uncharacterized protein n=1 Tax=Laetiporus sulphureus 93-53 TaxID=1314785 RepID=A0A165DKU0_9APHY|nr:uncharacterized protein LAESUDRAFT_242195 [Laetiporus sulphureus 93-53]KZT05105.1 hypothetical protein LAESUDRAFT_242195 [Laetiporus sulphureus 93-53]